VIDRGKYAPADGLAKGAYVLADCSADELKLILIATGSEVHIALGACEVLRRDGCGVRVVSMPSWELFEAQSDEYRDAVLPKEVTARIAVEAGATLGWERYVDCHGRIIGINRFGASAPGEANRKKFGFTVANVVAQAKELLQ
jgi:transketolase